LSRDVSQEQGFGDETLEFEIPTGLHLAALAGVEPFSSLPGDLGSVFGGCL
jgi:hypothetical protein